MNSDFNIGINTSWLGIGDSLTNGMLGAIANLLPQKQFYYEGIGGQTAQQIACRQGGSSVYLSLASGTTITGATETIVIPTIQLYSTPASSNDIYKSGKMLVTQSGQNVWVPGVLRRYVVSSAETYSLRIVQQGGTVSTVSANTQFIPDDVGNYRDMIQLLVMGRNNSSNLTGIEKVIQGCVERIANPRRYFIVGVLNNTNEGIGTAAYTRIKTFNTLLQSTYPDNYISFGPPSQAEMDAIFYTPSSQDLQEIAIDTMPTGLRISSSDFHPNSFGNMIMANRIVDKARVIGWV